MQHFNKHVIQRTSYNQDGTINTAQPVAVFDKRDEGIEWVHRICGELVDRGYKLERVCDTRYKLTGVGTVEFTIIQL